MTTRPPGPTTTRTCSGLSSDGGAGPASSVRDGRLKRGSRWPSRTSTLRTCWYRMPRIRADLGATVSFAVQRPNLVALRRESCDDLYRWRQRVYMCVHCRSPLVSSLMPIGCTRYMEKNQCEQYNYHRLFMAVSGSTSGPTPGALRQCERSRSMPVRFISRTRLRPRNCEMPRSSPSQQSGPPWSGNSPQNTGLRDGRPFLASSNARSG